MVSLRRHSQAETVTTEIERCRLRPQPRCRGLSGSDETDRTGRESVADYPEEEHTDCGLAGCRAAEEPCGGETDVEAKHGKASTVSVQGIRGLSLCPSGWPDVPDKKRATTDIFTADQGDEDCNHQEHKAVFRMGQRGSSISHDGPAYVRMEMMKGSVPRLATWN